MRALVRTIGLLLLLVGLASAWQQPEARGHRNLIIFVADGLRRGSVNAKDTPALWQLRTEGVDFRNSYSLFPTFTTANASAIATGHGLGDTGDFSNAIWVGHATYDTGNYDLAPGTPVPFIENDRALGDLDDHFGGNYLGEETLLALARAAGYNTAVIGKLGPAAIQDARAVAPVNRQMPPAPEAIVIDDATGTPAGLALSSPVREQFLEANLPPEAPARTNGFALTSRYANSYSGDRTHPGTLAPNTLQQQWMADVLTRVVLPIFDRQEKPFAVVYWSRDPDASQHGEGDSLHALSPGINGDTAIAGIRNADRNLRQILDWLNAHPRIKRNTDILVTSDHGFATVSRREIDAARHPSTAESAQHFYLDADGKVDVQKGDLPPGCVAIDLAVALQTKLWDPDRRGSATSRFPFREVRIGALDSATGKTAGPADWERPSSGNGLLGPKIDQADGSDATAIVAANGGSDLVYVPSGKPEIVQKIVDALLRLDYVGAIFVDDKYPSIGGTLPLSAINLVGATRLPRPAIVVALKSFYLESDNLQSGIQISDTSLQEGQGMHGGFGRDQTYNNMAAFGPDFKRAYVDNSPFSNADIVPTVAHVLGLELKPVGKLTGRVAREVFLGGNTPPLPVMKTDTSSPAQGKRTVLNYQEFDGVRYVHSADLQPVK
jgi:arylsulfatase A-like enzyme